MESRSEAVFTYSKGLDKASKPFEADPSRALDELNYVYRDGKVQKRHGLNELLTVKPTEYIKVGFDGTEATSASMNAVEWNGIWRFKAEDRKYHVVAHIGKLMYEVYEENGSFKCEPITSGTGISTRSSSDYPKCYEFEDYRSVAVVAANSLYFFGGNKFMRLRYMVAGDVSYRIFSPVENDSATYIPTTTISITYEGAQAGSRASLDQVNLMSDFRKNLLLSGVGFPPEEEKVPEYYEYTLDSPLIARNRALDMASFSIVLQERSN